MKEVIITKPQKEDIILLDDVSEREPIFFIEDGAVLGMLVNERKEDKECHWIVRIGGDFGISGFFETAEKAMRSALVHHKNAGFYIDIKIK